MSLNTNLRSELGPLGHPKKDKQILRKEKKYGKTSKAISKEQEPLTIQLCLPV
jgi:hypothetical protein